MFDCLWEERTPSIKEHGHLHAGNRPGKAVGGGIHWVVYSSYQVPPNIHTKYALYSECTG